MSQFGAIYLQFDERDQDAVADTVAPLKKGGYLFTVRYMAEKPWIQLHLDEPEGAAYHAEGVSKLMPGRDVIGLGAYTSSDSVIIASCRDGAVLRRLKSGFQSEGCFDEVSGTPQPWESVFTGVTDIQPGASGLAGFHLENLALELGLPGFGDPAPGGAWTVEIPG